MTPKKQPTTTQVKAAVAKYLEKHMGDGIQCGELDGSYYLKDSQGIELIINADLSCSIGVERQKMQDAPAIEKELRSYILDMAEDAPEAPRTEVMEGKMIMPQRAQKPAIGQMVAPIGELTMTSPMRSLTPQDIINYINPKATEAEAYLFTEFCRRKGADPMTKQVYLVIYGEGNDRKANFIAGKEYFTEKAEAHPQFSGFQAGIIVRSKDKADAPFERRVGTFWLSKEEDLLGGWAEVERKDRESDFVIDVPLADYNTGKNQWAKMPATMIRKVALVQALREAFPANFGGMYDRAEMDQAYDPSREAA